jgi:hypothetical protein
MMANVYEGPADSRQSDDEELPVSRFRPRYRALSISECEFHDELKSQYAAVEDLVDQLPPGRYRSLALTALEQSCMWAVKQLTDNNN